MSTVRMMINAFGGSAAGVLGSKFFSTDYILIEFCLFPQVKKEFWFNERCA